MGEFGKEYTGQPYINDKEQMACPVCGKAISARSTGWIDRHCSVKFESPSGKETGTYVCRSCLSDERKAEILLTNPNSNFDSEKDWVNKEQSNGPQAGPLENMLLTVTKYHDDPVMMDGVNKVFEAFDKIKAQESA